MKDYDVVVVGGGAAGLSAALALLRARRTVVLVDAGARRNAPAAHMHGFLSRDGMPPRDLLTVGRAEVASYGGRLIDDTVVGIEPGFQVRLANAAHLHACRILVATGLSDELPDIPGVRERWGRDLLHCPYCDGYEVRDQPLGVLGGGLRLSGTRCWYGSGRPTSPCSHIRTPSRQSSASTWPPGASASSKARSRGWWSAATSCKAWS
jgi:thioredoxin reductase